MKKPLRILVVDSDDKWSLGASYWRGFKALGHDARMFVTERWMGNWTGGRARQIANTALRPLTTPAVNLALLTAVMAEKPDFVFVIRGTYLLPETLEAMKTAASVVGVYYSDDLKNPLNTNEQMLKCVPLWSFACGSRSFAGPEVLAMGAKRWETVFFGYDPILSYPAREAPLPESGIDTSAVFIGSHAPDRELMLTALAIRAPLKVWGGAWHKVANTSPLKPCLRLNHLVDEPLRAVLSQAAISVAFLRAANRDRHVMRTFEVPACAGFMLAERSEEHLALFEEGKEAVFFEGAEELVAQVERYLPDEKGRRAIADAGFRRITSGGHSYTDRAAQVAQVAEEMLP